MYCGGADLYRGMYRPIWMHVVLCVTTSWSHHNRKKIMFLNGATIMVGCVVLHLLKLLHVVSLRRVGHCSQHKVLRYFVCEVVGLSLF